MAKASYDYEEQKAAHAQLEAAVESLKSGVKSTNDAGAELVAENNADGVKSTMSASAEQNNGLAQIARAALEESAKALNIVREAHVAAGGEA